LWFTFAAMKRVSPYFFIALLGALLFFHSLGKVALFDWDEINFAESAREMIATGNYMQVQINFEPFWEKPPLFFWMQSAAMLLLGENEIAARLPNAICGIVTLLVLFAIGKKTHDRNMAAWWVFLYTASFLPHLYFKSGIIDPWFNLFIFLSLYFLARFLTTKAEERQRWQMIALSSLFAGLGILTKGPVAMLVVVLSYLLFLLINRGKGWTSIRFYFGWLLGVLVVALLWFGLEIAQHGWWFVDAFVKYQIRLAQTKDAGHGGFLLYHFVVLLLGCFPASLLLFTRVRKPQTDTQEVFRKLMIASLLVILIVFTIVKTKIVHYSSFAYFPLVYLAALAVDDFSMQRISMRRWQMIALLLGGILWSVLFIALPWLGMHPEWLRIVLQQDAFALRNLDAKVDWTYLHMIPGTLFLIAVVISFLLFVRKMVKSAFIVLFIACIVAMQTLLTLFAPRIEKYSQHAAIQFFTSLQGKDVYVKTLGYKSYAQYFYTRIQPGQRKEAKDELWLLTGPVDKPTYFVSKITAKESILAEHGERLQVLYEENGFVFYQRKQ